MLSPTQLQELAKRRRDVQDFDLEWYLKVKTDILTLLIEVKNNLNDYSNILSDEAIEKLRENIKLAKLKVELSINFDQAKYSLTTADTQNYDTEIREHLTKCLADLTTEFEILNKKIKYIKDILNKRNTLNNTIIEYFDKMKIIKLSESELHSLFENDISDINVILSSGKLVSEDKSNNSNNIYEFKFSKNSSFTLSANELKSKIAKQISDCEQIQQNIANSKQLWKSSSTNLMDLLSKIETQVVI